MLVIYEVMTSESHCQCLKAAPLKASCVWRTAEEVSLCPAPGSRGVMGIQKGPPVQSCRIRTFLAWLVLQGSQELCLGLHLSSKPQRLITQSLRGL